MCHQEIINEVKLQQEAIRKNYNINITKKITSKNYVKISETITVKLKLIYWKHELWVKKIMTFKNYYKKQRL